MIGKKYIFKDLPTGEFIPEIYEDGIVYVGRDFNIAAFLCPCGCGESVALRIDSDVHPCWEIVGNTINPSVQRNTGCKSHFHITNGEVTT